MSRSGFFGDCSFGWGAPVQQKEIRFVTNAPVRASHWIFMIQDAVCGAATLLRLRVGDVDLINGPVSIDERCTGPVQTGVLPEQMVYPPGTAIVAEVRNDRPSSHTQEEAREHRKHFGAFSGADTFTIALDRTEKELWQERGRASGWL